MASLRFDKAFAGLLQATHLQLLGRPLIAGGPYDAAYLYNAMAQPLLAHDTSSDPRFIYANRAAQACFGYTPEEFAGLPSRLSAAPREHAARRRLLEDVARDGFAQGFSGIRIAKSGRRFRIEDATLWELIDGAGRHHGTAATFRIGADVV